MFSNLRQLMAFATSDPISLPAVGSSGQNNSSNSSSSSAELKKQKLKELFGYRRPAFLQLLSLDEVKASASHNVRPIIVPRDISQLPWGTGYAECVNSGKSRWNEDQGAFHRHVLSDSTLGHPDLPYTYFGIFDGHAGFGTAVAASQQLHHILHKKLVDCIDILLPRDPNDIKIPTLKSTRFFGLKQISKDEFCKRVSKDDVIIGALESAFFEMDDLIEQNSKQAYECIGGCTACVALFINGSVYVANAGDSRAVLCQRKSISATCKEANSTNSSHDNVEEDEDGVGSVVSSNETKRLSHGGEVYATPLSYDHTPETERPRLMNVAQHLNTKRDWVYNPNQYIMRPHREDIGLRILCRQGMMKGWIYKTVTEDDVMVPVVMGTGKRSRLLGTLGVTRGFGDHNLNANLSGIPIKPFLTPQPEVNYRDLTKIVSIPDENNEDGDYGILVLGTDGLWDVSENDAVAQTVFKILDEYPTEKYRYTMAAQQLVAKARGVMYKTGHWRLSHTDAAATADDISVFVIPIYQYYKEHVEWEQKCMRDNAAKTEAAVAEEITGEASANREEDSTQPLESTQNGTASGVELAAASGDAVKEKQLTIIKKSDNNAMEVDGDIHTNANVKMEQREEEKEDEEEKVEEEKIEWL